MEELFGKMQELMQDPESRQQLSELAAMLQGGMASPAPSGEASDGKAAEGLPFDPMLLLKLGELMQADDKPDENAALLLALRPHLREERQKKVDKAVKLLRLCSVWNVLKESGLLQNLL